MAFRNVISTLTPDGQEMLGPGILLFHYPSAEIQNGTLLTVESNHFCVLKSRGAILEVYETGQYPVSSPQRALIGGIQQAFYGGQSPWQYEAIYISRAKSVLKARGTAMSREMAELDYDVDYYVHVDSREDALKLVQHMPYAGHTLTGEALNAYAGPVVEQAINQLVQVTPLEEINERIHDLCDLVRAHLQDFLSVYGITLNDVKVLVLPRDPLMKRLISLKAFGLTEEQAVRYYIALQMAERGLVSAPNMAVGLPFSIGGTPSLPMSIDGITTPAPPAAMPAEVVPPAERRAPGSGSRGR